jgi:hypothetical protein
MDGACSKYGENETYVRIFFFCNTAREMTIRET